MEQVTERFSDEETDKIPGEDDDIDLYGDRKQTPKGPKPKAPLKQTKVQQEVQKLESSPNKSSRDKRDLQKNNNWPPTE